MFVLSASCECKMFTYQFNLFCRILLIDYDEKLRPLYLDAQSTTPMVFEFLLHKNVFM